MGVDPILFALLQQLNSLPSSPPSSPSYASSPASPFGRGSSSAGGASPSVTAAQQGVSSAQQGVAAAQQRAAAAQANVAAARAGVAAAAAGPKIRCAKCTVKLPREGERNEDELFVYRCRECADAATLLCFDCMRAGGLVHEEHDEFEQMAVVDEERLTATGVTFSLLAQRPGCKIRGRNPTRRENGLLAGRPRKQAKSKSKSKSSSSRSNKPSKPAGPGRGPARGTGGGGGGGGGASAAAASGGPLPAGNKEEEEEEGHGSVPHHICHAEQADAADVLAWLIRGNRTPRVVHAILLVAGVMRMAAPRSALVLEAVADFHDACAYDATIGAESAEEAVSTLVDAAGGPMRTSELDAAQWAYLERAERFVQSRRRDVDGMGDGVGDFVMALLSPVR